MFSLGAKTAFKFQCSEYHDFFLDLAGFTSVFCPLPTKCKSLMNPEMLFVDKYHYLATV